MYYQKFVFDNKCHNCEEQATSTIVRMTADYPSLIVQTLHLCAKHTEEFEQKTTDKKY